MTANTAILDVMCQGDPNGPADLDSYPAGLYIPAVGTVADSLGYGNRECGSYAAWMVLSAGGTMPPKSQLGLPGDWPANADPSWIVTDPQPGDIAVIPAMAALPKGHALYVSCICQGTPDLLTKSYNSMETGDFELGVWTTSGEVNGEEFSLVFIRFPAAA